MKKIIFILIIFITGFYSCKTSIDDTEIKNRQLIEGDWVRKIGDVNLDTYVFSFEDSICSIFYPTGPYSKYEIIGETLFIQKPPLKSFEQPECEIKFYHFKIVKLTTDVLRIIAINNNSKKLFKEYKTPNPDTLNLTRVKPKNEMKFDRLAFFSTACFGSCPVMYLEIDSIGNFLFEGFYYTNVRGLFSGKLKLQDLNCIKRKIFDIDIVSLDKYYEYYGTDVATRGILIQSKDKIIESSAYGFSTEPVELRILFHKLMEVYKYTYLTVDSTIIKKFYFKDYIWKNKGWGKLYLEPQIKYIPYDKHN